MFSVLDFMEAFGTSEGVKKGWESRARTGAVLQGHGWRQSTTSQFTHPIHTNHRIIVGDSGSWRHEKEMSKGGPVDEGSGQNGADLQKHLQNYRWSNKHLGRNVN